jgi:hypothetical protein
LYVVFSRSLQWASHLELRQSLWYGRRKASKLLYSRKLMSTCKCFVTSLPIYCTYSSSLDADTFVRAEFSPPSTASWENQV